MAVIEIYSLKPKDFRILIKIHNKIEFMSRSFDQRLECFKIIRLIRNISHLNTTYELKKLGCGSWSFEFINPDDKSTLGWGETYIDKTIVLHKIAEMKMAAPRAKLKINRSLV